MHIAEDLVTKFPVLKFYLGPTQCKFKQFVYIRFFIITTTTTIRQYAGSRSHVAK